MDKLFGSNISIERLAAYLDENLSVSEMQGISALIDGNENLSVLCKTSEDINHALNMWRIGLSSEDYSLPEELSDLNFDIPNFDTVNHGILNFARETSIEDTIGCVGYEEDGIFCSPETTNIDIASPYTEIVDTDFMNDDFSPSE